MKNTTVLPSQLYITEATESKVKTEADLKVVDPEKTDAESILEKHIINESTSRNK